MFFERKFWMQSVIIFGASIFKSFLTYNLQFLFVGMVFYCVWIGGRWRGLVKTERRTPQTGRLFAWRHWESLLSEFLDAYLGFTLPYRALPHLKGAMWYIHTQLIDVCLFIECNDQIWRLHLIFDNTFLKLFFLHFFFELKKLNVVSIFLFCWSKFNKKIFARFVNLPKI